MVNGTSREQLETNGFKIKREVVNTSGDHFIKLQKGEDDCLLLRDNGNDIFLLLRICSEEEADKFLNKILA